MLLIIHCYSNNINTSVFLQYTTPVSVRYLPFVRTQLLTIVLIYTHPSLQLLSFVWSICRGFLQTLGSGEEMGWGHSVDSRRSCNLWDEITGMCEFLTHTCNIKVSIFFNILFSQADPSHFFQFLNVFCYIFWPLVHVILFLSVVP